VKSSVEALEGNKVKVYVEVEEGEFEHDIDRAFRAIAKEVRLPGFRAGKVPRRVLEARIGIGPAREQALRDAVPQYLAKAVREHDVDLIATPEVEITDGEEDGPIEFDATCEVRPVITLTAHRDLTVELPAIEVGEEALEEARNDELRRHGTLVTADRPAEIGDFVTLDLVATRGDEEVPGLNTEDWSYEIGQGWVSDDFDEQLVGASTGDELTFTSTPKATDEPADFTVQVTAVQTMQLPELSDEWVSENFGEFDSIEAWNDSLRESLGEKQLGEVRQQLVSRVHEGLAELVEIELPESMVNGELNQRVQNMAQQFAGQGIDLGQWLGATGQDPEGFVESMRPQAITAVKVDLALRAVADAEAIEVAEQELDGEYARMAMQYGRKAKEIRKVYEDNDAVAELISQIRKAKALDWLVHHAAFVDPDGNELDRDHLLGHAHDEQGNHLPDVVDHEITVEQHSDADSAADEATTESGKEAES
jgi:trigger factor